MEPSGTKMMMTSGPIYTAAVMEVKKRCRSLKMNFKVVFFFYTFNIFFEPPIYYSNKGLKTCLESRWSYIIVAETRQ